MAPATNAKNTSKDELDKSQSSNPFYAIKKVMSSRGSNDSLTELDNSSHSVREVLEEATKPKYTYSLPVDPLQDDRATEIRLMEFGRPHMRAFHLAWLGFFMAFVAWFAIAPILPVIRESLGLTKNQMWVSNICSVSATVVMRFIVGPLCDKYGPRRVMAYVLTIGSIPTFLVGTINSFAGLCTIRFFIGAIGSTFVMCQYWTSQMFARNCVGTANAIAGGWGNVGGGFTQLFMGSLMYPLFLLFTDGDSELAWRTVFIVPASLAVATGVMTYYLGDDSPKGNYEELKQKDELISELIGHKKAPETVSNTLGGFLTAVSNPNTLIMMLHYASCFGVELTMNNAAASYFYDKFDGLSLSKAAAIASSFGFMNIVARGFGGYLSDYLNGMFSLRGRLAAQFVCILLEGCMILVFASQNSLAGAICTMIIFSIFVQAAEGAVYGVVPYIDPLNTGSVTGAVGAGGNIGAVCWGMIFLFGDGYKSSFFTLGYIIIAASVLVFFVRIPGYAGLLFGEENPLEQVKAKVQQGMSAKHSVDELVAMAEEQNIDMVQMAGGTSGKIVKRFSSREFSVAEIESGNNPELYNAPGGALTMDEANCV